MIATAYAASPAKPEISGTYGAWLVTFGRAKEGMPLLIGSVRRLETNAESAEQAG